MRYLSPLRYPGGKARLASFITDVIDLNGPRGCAYYEPYAGGAGAALALLRDGVVAEVFLNDADRRVFAFWRSLLDETDRFVEQVLAIPVTIEEWHKQRAICAAPKGHAKFAIGFSTFFMNRCNRSGVLTGAGPIGGYGQRGQWRLDVRFYRAELAQRVIELGRQRERIHVSCQDAITFLKAKLPRGRGRARAFAYLDPPYVNNGQRLYLNAYKPDDHGELARYIQAQKTLRWIMSYDDSDLVRRLYSSCRIATLPIMYSLQVKRSAHELVVAPRHIAVPAVCRAAVAAANKKAS